MCTGQAGRCWGTASTNSARHVFSTQTPPLDMAINNGQHKPKGKNQTLCPDGTHITWEVTYPNQPIFTRSSFCSNVQFPVSAWHVPTGRRR